MKKRSYSLLLSVTLFMILSGCIEDTGNYHPSHLNASLLISPSKSGYAPFNVTFYINATDSDGYIVSWSLDTNNDGIPEFTGNGSELPKTINYTYTAGNYTAKLIVIDNNGNTYENVEDVVVTAAENKTENMPPICSISANVTQGYAPIIVTFSLTAYDNDGHIISWRLDVDNDGIAEYTGSDSPPQTKQHTYENAGVYTANFTVMDNDGATASNTVQIVVNEMQPSNQPPNADFTYSIEDFTVTFTDTSYDLDGNIVSWHWDFGDGEASDQQNPVHTYADYGTYSVTLTVTDDNGAEDETTVTITIEWQPEYGVKYEVHVITVIDGDTFDAAFPNGNIERVRMLGVDTPETTASENDPNEYDGITDLECLAYWGTEAKNFARSWLEGKDVYIEFDASAGFKGYYSRWLCYVYLLNNTDFNAELIKRGLARVYEEGTCSREDYYLTLQQQAIDNRVGLWSCMTEEGSGGVVIMTVHYDADGNDWYNLNDEYVVIKNEGNKAVDMSGWTLSDEANHVYRFPSGFVLNTGATVTVYTGSGTNTDSKLYWGSDSPIWNNDGDTAYLKDDKGNLVDSWSW